MVKMLDTSLEIGIAGPRGIPTVNNLRFLADSASYVLGRLAPMATGSVVPVTSGNGSLVMAHGEAAVKQVFTDNDTFHRANDGMVELPGGHPWSGMFDVVLMANGLEHRRRRKLLAPVFHSSVMPHYEAMFVRTFERSRFAARDPGTFDIADEFRSIARTNMLVSLLGLPPDGSNLELARRVSDLLNAMFDPTVLMFRRSWWWTPYSRWIRRVEETYRLLAALIEARRADPPQDNALSILCHSTDETGRPLPTPEIAGELHGLFAAGYETTASAMTWAMLTSLCRPDRDLGDLDGVISETQRLLPTLPVSLPRRVTKDVRIAGSPTVPRGAVVFVSPLLEHRDPEVFADPGEFRPSRWAHLRPSPYVYLPFGIGRRRCPGAAFAELQTRTTLRLILETRPWRLLTTHADYRTRSGVISFPWRPVLVETGCARKPVVLTGSVARLCRPW